MEKNVKPIYSRIIIILYFITLTQETYSFENDHLTPYLDKPRAKKTRRQISNCYSSNGKKPFEIFRIGNQTEYDLKTNHYQKMINDKFLNGHYSLISNPLKTISVLEPWYQGGCAMNKRETAQNSATQRECQIAINAGYFNMKTGACLGYIVSDGRKVRKSGGIQNAHFGLNKAGNLFFGYLDDNEYEKGDFLQLVGGVIWLLRNGTEYINQSIGLECDDTEDTGSMDDFVNVHSARTAIGHDSEGRIIIFQVDGKTSKYGATLWDMALIMKELGAINAINLDGGGSSTFIVNNTLVSNPSDQCDDINHFNCPRKVSTIICVHYPDCNPKDCSGNGICNKGKCQCRDTWKGEKCNLLACHNDSLCSNGVCTLTGCACNPGWKGKMCNITCDVGWYGSDCNNKCFCLNEAFCDSITGNCICQPGYIGIRCEEKCPDGKFGLNCNFICSCKNSCFCDYINGTCISEDITNTNNKCLYNKYIEEKTLKDEETHLGVIWKLLTAGISLLTIFSLTVNIMLMFCPWNPKNATKNEFDQEKLLKRKTRNKTTSFSKKTRKKKPPYKPIQLGNIIISCTSESEE